MKSFIASLLAASALTLGASPARAGYAGYYLATFSYPGGTFQHCFALTQTQQYKSQGYKYSGTWVDTDFANTSGTWVVAFHDIHLAGVVGGDAYLTIDGAIGQGQLTSSTFDYFDASGNYFAAGSLTEMLDTSCAGAPRRPIHH